MLDKYNQEHLLKYKDRLNSHELSQLMKEIENIDFELVQDIYNKKNNEDKNTQSDFKPIKGVKLSDEEKTTYTESGLEEIELGHVAAVLMAGGQGTRLGHSGPKGTYNIGLPSGKSLFELQCDKLFRLKEMTNTYIHWYIMTSEDNHEASVEHFVVNDYFGYSKKHIHFFKQDRLPLILENGQIAMKSPSEINLAANGNGGVFSSLKSNGLIDHMTANNIEYVYLYGVDNAIAKVADPTFVGFAKASGHDIVNKAVEKKNPDEKVGVFCYRDGHPGIVEYSELPDDLRYAMNEDKSLTFRYGNILSHIFKLDFLKACVDKSLPYHTAHKKVNYYDERYIEATEPNGYKFELFLFDVFKYVDDMGVLSVERDEEFTPVKNKEGNDSPKDAVSAILAQHNRWLSNAGYNMSSNIEIDGKQTYNGENLQNIKEIKLYE